MDFPLLIAIPRSDGADVVLALPSPKDVRLPSAPKWVLPLLTRCDGRTPVDALLEELDADEQHQARRLLKGLAAAGAMCDRRDCFQHFHRLTSRPYGLIAEYGAGEQEEAAKPAWSPSADGAAQLRMTSLPDDGLARLLRRRRSWPNDGPQPKSPEAADVMRVCAMVLGEEDGHRWVPAAGALNTLVAHLLVMTELDGLPAALYHVPSARRLVRLAAPPPELPPLLASSPGASDATALLFLSSDVRRAALKYSSRGYRFALMECGAAMQTAYLASTELNIGVRALGGFEDSAVAGMLRLPEHAYPLLGMALGGA